MAVELRETGVELERLVTVDSLFGVLNQRAPFERLDLEVLRSLRYRHHLTELTIDLDHFNRLDDDPLHWTGDLVLIEAEEH